MNQGSIDLTTEDIERLAAEVWDVAAKEALAKGLPVTGYHDGHLFRYHPDKGIEDLAVARFAAEPAPSTDGVDDSPSRRSAAAPAGDIAEHGSSAAAPDETPPASADAPAAIAAGNDAAARESLADFGVKAIEFARQNAHATLELTAKLLAAKSFAEMVELSTAHAYGQFEAFSAQGKHLGKDLAELAPKPAADTAESAEHGGETAPPEAGPAG